MLAAILDFSDRTMIQANHPRFSCISDMPLIIYVIIFSGPLMHTDTPSGTVLFRSFQNMKVKKSRTIEAEEKLTFSQTKFTIWGASSCHLCGLVSLTFYNAWVLLLK